MSEFSRVYISDLSDRELMQFWAAVCASGRDRSFMYCFPKMDGSDFCRFLRQPFINPWLVLFRDVPFGLFYLADRKGKTAQAHICTLPMGTMRTRETPIGRLPAVRALGIYAMGKALWERNVSGGFIMDTLVGFTPVCNKDFVKYVHSIGAQDCGIVPGICYYHDTNENVPGLITYCTREFLPEWTAQI